MRVVNETRADVPPPDQVDESRAASCRPPAHFRKVCNARPHTSPFLSGASFWWVHDNVCDASPLAWAFFMTGGAGLPAKNNRMERLWYRATGTPQNDCAQWNCTVDSTTIIPVTGAWPSGAQRIIDASGASS